MTITKPTATVHIDSLTNDWISVDLMRAFDVNECHQTQFFESISAAEIDLEEELGNYPIVKFDGSTVLLMAANEGKCNLMPWRIGNWASEIISSDELETVLSVIDGWLVAVLVPVGVSNSRLTVSFAFIQKKNWLRAGAPAWIDTTDEPTQSTASGKDACRSKAKQVG